MTVVHIAHPVTDPTTGVSYAVGTVVDLPATIAHRMVIAGMATYDSSVPAPPVDVSAQILQQMQGYLDNITSLATQVQETADSIGDAVAPPPASATTPGLVRLATSQEMTDGALATVAGTPAGIKALFDTFKSQLYGGAPAAALDTLVELGNALSSDESAIGSLTSQIAGKQGHSTVLDALALLTVTTYGSGLLSVADAAALTTKISAATTTQAGVAKIATNALIDTGTDPSTIVSPAGLAHALSGFTPSGGGGGGAIYPWIAAAGVYPDLPTTKPAGTVLVWAVGPTKPPSAKLQSWSGSGAGQAPVRLTIDSDLA